MTRSKAIAPSESKITREPPNLRGTLPPPQRRATRRLALEVEAVDIDSVLDHGAAAAPPAAAAAADCGDGDSDGGGALADRIGARRLAAWLTELERAATGGYLRCWAPLGDAASDTRAV